MDIKLVPYNDIRSFLIPEDANKDTRYRLGKFADWLTSTGKPWYEPNLADYRDQVLKGYAPATASAHLSTIRARFRAILRDNETRDTLYAQVAEAISQIKTFDTPASRKAYVDEILIRLSNAIDPGKSTVKRKKSQDKPDSAHLRLTTEQANYLLSLPGVDTLVGLRDTAILAMLLCTGIREGELAALDVPDLRQTLGGALALHIKEGKGCKERLVPYGDLEWVLAIVDKWLELAEIDDGPIFRGFYRGNRVLRPGQLRLQYRRATGNGRA